MFEFSSKVGILALGPEGSHARAISERNVETGSYKSSQSLVKTGARQLNCLVISEVLTDAGNILSSIQM